MHFVKAKTLLNRENGMNVYRGCMHGCVYCDSRSRCYQFTHSFEDIEVKENAPELLEKILRTKRKKIMIGTGAMCDPYQPCETELKIVRRCLELIDRYEFGAAVLTKSDRVLRDIDLLESINRKAKAVVQMSLTIADEGLSQKIEPNVCSSKRRFEVLKEFRKAGIPTVVWMTPILPFLTDTKENLETILDWCIEAGVKGIVCWNFGMTLREGNREYYYQALDKHFPGLTQKYIDTYGNSYEVISERNSELMQRFREQCTRHGIMYTPEECFAYMHELPERYEQMSLF